jgi:endonuclease YncB( thermonuclease family)
MKIVYLTSLLTLLIVEVSAHSGRTDAQGCHAGSKPYHCHNAKSTQKKNSKILSGIITNVRDGDTIEVNGVPIRLAALDCPEMDTQPGRYAAKKAKEFAGLEAFCELTGAKTYDRLVGYCKINGLDFGEMMMRDTDCKVWEKYDVLDRY